MMIRLTILMSCMTICYIANPIPTVLAGEGERASQEVYADAMQAIEREEYRRALDLLELAEFKDPKPRYVYRRILVLEELGEHQRAQKLLEARRQELAGQPGVGDLTALEQRLEEATAERPATEPSVDGPGTDVLGWGLVGSGAAASAGGVVLLMMAESEIDQVRCSGIYPEAQRTDCDGVDAPAHLSQSEFDERLGRASAERVVGGSLLAAGVLAAGWGAYRLMSAEQPQARDASGRDTTEPSAAWQPDWSMAVSPRGDAQLSLSWMF